MFLDRTPTTSRVPIPFPVTADSTGESDIHASTTDTPGPRVSSPSEDWPSVRGYDVLSIIGSGGMGVVYKARHRELRRAVAIKTLRGAALDDPEYRERFRAEAESVARLQHSNIVQVFEIGAVDARPGEARPRPFIALEFVDGGTLDRLTDAPQPPRNAARVVEKLARAAHAAHRVGVVHRDLKPANVLLTRDGEPKITDFGVAKQIGAEPDADGRFLTQPGFVMGTAEYMAPEQAIGAAPTPAVDTYALGVILYELLTGRLPFRGPNAAATMDLVRRQEPVSPRRLQPGVPRDLETICLKCLAKAPGRRYESAEALADDLARFAAGRTIKARPVGPAERAALWVKRQPTAAALAATVILVGVAGAVGVVSEWREARRHAAHSMQKEAEAREAAAAGQWELYRAEIVVASNALRLNDAASARRALALAPELHRDWEWRYLSRRLDVSRNTLVSLGEPVRKTDFTPHARRVALVADDGTVHVWDVERRRRVGTIPRDPDLSFQCMDPAGEVVADVPNGAGNDTVLLRSAATGRRLATLRGLDSGSITVHFSPDGTRILSGSVGGTVWVWDTKTGAPVSVLRGLTDPNATISFSPDGRRVAAPAGRVVMIWDTETGRRLGTFTGYDANVATVEFSPDGARLLTVEVFPSNRLRLWDLATGRQLAVLAGHRNHVTWLSFSPDGRRLVTAAMDQTVRLWDGGTGRLIAELKGHTGSVGTAAFSPDGKRIVSASADQTLRLWDGDSGAPLGVLHGHADEVKRAAFSADGKSIVSVSRDGTVRLWDVRSAEHEGVLFGHTSFVYDVAFHPDGRRAASVAWDGTVRVWDATAGRELRAMSHGPGVPVISVAFHPAGRLLASKGRDNTVRLWDVDTGAEVHRWHVKAHGWMDATLAFSPAGDLLAVGDMDKSIHLFDTATRAEVAVLRGHEHIPSKMAFSPDGRWLVSGDTIWREPIRVWDVARREPAFTLPAHDDCVYALAFQTRGGLLASGSKDGVIRLWDTETWQQVAELKPQSCVYGLAFTPDGKRLAAGCADNSVRLFDVATGQEVAALRGHGDYVHAVAFSPDGSRLVSGSGDFTLRVWDTLAHGDR